MCQRLQLFAARHTKWHVKKFNDAIDCDKGETPETQSSGEATSREVTKPSFNSTAS